MTDNDTAVVKPYYATEQAYRDGYERFEGINTAAEEEFGLEPFRQTAAYANSVLPSLRAAAGFGDPGGHGTYTENRTVAAVKPGCEEDNPADAELVDSRHILDELQQAWERGAYDAVEGREPDPDRVADVSSRILV